MGSYIIEKTSGPMFFLILGIIMLVSLIGFCSLRIPKGGSHQHLSEEALVKDDHAYAGDEDHQKEQISFMEVTRSTIRLLFSQKMMMLNLELVYSGTILSYWSCMLIPMMALQLNRTNPEYHETHVDSLALQAMVFFGVGEVVSGMIMGQVNDKLKTKYTCLVNIFIILITTVLTELNLY